MANTIFFSWQADHAYKSCKNIVEAALQRALVIIHQNLPIDEAEREEFEIDKDTKGVPGMPEIVATIFKKIDASAMFVADLTFVGTRADGRPTPNPNVLIEYGWALRALGHGRMIAVMNSAYGEPTQTSMPFDMKHLRFPITFNCPDGAPAEVRKVETEKLAKILAGAIESILESDDFKAGLPKPSELEQFMPMVPRDGKARFRDAGHSLGVQDNGMSRLFGGTPAEVKLRAGGAFWFRVRAVVRTIDERKIHQTGIWQLPML